MVRAQRLPGPASVVDEIDAVSPAKFGRPGDREDLAQIAHA